MAYSMLHSMRLLTALLLSLFANAFVPLSTYAESITVDTIIDGTSSFNGKEIIVSNGDDGPTTVRVVEGGSIAGFRLEENSHLILDGGEVTFLSGLTDDSTFTILSGDLSCSEIECQAIDFNTLINASGNSAIILNGQFGLADFGLTGGSTLTVYGTGLTKTDPNAAFEFTVSGTLLDGAQFQTRVSARPDQILLIEVPEPAGSILVFSALLFFATQHRWL